MHLKHLDGSNEKVPYFCLPANELNDVIAPSCYSCFDYPNALADLVRSACAPMSRSCYELQDASVFLFGVRAIYFCTVMHKPRMASLSEAWFQQTRACCRWWATWACHTTGPR